MSDTTPDGFEEFREQNKEYFPDIVCLEEQIKVYKSLISIPKKEVDPDNICRTINENIKKDLVNESDKRGGEHYFFTITTGKNYGVTPNRNEIAMFIHAQLHTVAFNDTIYTYNAAPGIYTPGQGVVDAAINELCKATNHEELITNLQRFVPVHLKGMDVYSKYPFDQIPNRIPFANGTVRLSGNKWILEPIRPSDMVTWRLNIDYDPAASSIKVQDVLSQWVDESDVPKLTQIPAQALLQMTQSQPYKMNYLLVGDRDAAKSTYIDLLQAGFGQDKCAEVPLQNIGMRFKNAEMEGKLLNIYDDLSDKEFSNLGSFKKLTGRFQHSIERKGMDPYEGLIKCVHVFSCNKPPVLSDTADDAFLSRWQPIIFPNSFTRDPDWFKKTITPKFLSGFANMILDQYISIRENKIQVDQSVEEIKEFWLRESMPEYGFIKSCLEEGVGYTIPIAECYDLYKDWMINIRCQTPSKIKDLIWFGRSMNKSQLIKTGQETVNTSKGKSRIDVYKGIRKKIPKGGVNDV